MTLSSAANTRNFPATQAFLTNGPLAKPAYVQAPLNSFRCHPAPNQHSSRFQRPLRLSSPKKWKARVSFFPAFLKKGKDAKELKEELLEAIAPLDRGVEATPEDQERIDQLARNLEAVNKIKEPLKSDLLNGKWELIYTTSTSILQKEVTADLTPLSPSKVAVKFDYFKILGLIPVKAPDRARGQLDITYLDEDLRISRGDKGNLFILKMVDRSYRIPS